MMMDTMDHREVRELLEDAAIEPGGLDRIMAGDVAAASIVAGHLAGCADCAEELERLRRSVGLIRPTVRAVPPPELRERTLAYVAALGRPRGARDAGVPTATIVSSAAPAAAPESVVALSGRRAGRTVRGGRLGWFASLAAALIVAVTGTALLVSANRDSTNRALSAEIDALGDVTRWTLRVDAQSDVRRIELASATGTSTIGNLLFSPTSTELVMVADHLTPAPAGHEYRCWVEIGGQRSSIGRMFFGGDLAYWVGTVPEIAGIGPDARFGVSLVDLGATGAPGIPVLTGS
jgi:Anti-sigma-K factor rskA